VSYTVWCLSKSYEHKNNYKKATCGKKGKGKIKIKIKKSNSTDRDKC
jgi:hypothetical protein